MTAEICVSPAAIAKAINDLLAQRDELASVLRVYLTAGNKEQRRSASVIAKAALAKVTT